MARLQELLSWRSESKTLTQTKIPQTHDEVENQDSGTTLLEEPLRGEGVDFVKKTQEADASYMTVRSLFLQEDHPLTTQQKSPKQDVMVASNNGGSLPIARKDCVEGQQLFATFGLSKIVSQEPSTTQEKHLCTSATKTQVFSLTYNEFKKTTEHILEGSCGSLQGSLAVSLFHSFSQYLGKKIKSFSKQQILQKSEPQLLSLSLPLALDSLSPSHACSQSTSVSLPQIL